MRGGRGVVEAGPQLAALVVWLRRGLDGAGRGRQALARRAGWSVSSVGAAVAGRVVPSWELTAAIAAVCGLDVVVTTRLWRAARAEREGFVGVADPDAAGTAAEFVRELRVLLLDAAGLVGVRAVAAGAGLSRSAAGRALQGDAVPAPGVLEALLAPCRLAFAEHERWMAARDRLAGVAVGAVPVVVAPVPGASVSVLAPGEVRPPLVAVPRMAEAGPPAGTPDSGLQGPHVTPGVGSGGVRVAAKDRAPLPTGVARGSQYLDAAVLAVWVARELRGLHAGLGVQRVGLEVGRTLSEVCGVDLGAPAHAQRRQLEAALVAAAGELPAGVAWPALVAFNLVSAEEVGRGLAAGESWGPFWSTYVGRVGFVAEKMARDPRTVRRYITQAEQRLAEVLVSRYFQHRDQAVGKVEDVVRGVARERGTDASAARSATS